MASLNKYTGQPPLCQSSVEYRYMLPVDREESRLQTAFHTAYKKIPVWHSQCWADQNETMRHPCCLIIHSECDMWIIKRGTNLFLNCTHSSLVGSMRLIKSVVKVWDSYDLCTFCMSWKIFWSYFSCLIAVVLYMSLAIFFKIQFAVVAEFTIFCAEQWMPFSYCLCILF